MANLILVLTLAGKSPDLHGLLHHNTDAEEACSEEVCVIDLFSGGQVLGSDPVVVSLPTHPEAKEAFPTSSIFRHYLTGYLFVRGRGPPSMNVTL